MSNKALERLVWILIYSGLLLAGLGVFLMHSDTLLGWIFVIAGLVDAAAGAVLVWVRSRRKG
ncbi:MAG: hypothetical protein U5L05_09500 [Rubrivivax sp.]|nr:hypothetical protein [Rubrivivax sp.]